LLEFVLLAGIVTAEKALTTRKLAKKFLRTCNFLNIGFGPISCVTAFVMLFISDISWWILILAMVLGCLMVPVGMVGYIAGRKESEQLLNIYALAAIGLCLGYTIVAGALYIPYIVLPAEDAKTGSTSDDLPANGGLPTPDEKWCM
jgi:hypothetical protein